MCGIRGWLLVQGQVMTRALRGIPMYCFMGKLNSTGDKHHLVHGLEAKKKRRQRASELLNRVLYIHYFQSVEGRQSTFEPWLRSQSHPDGWMERMGKIPKREQFRTGVLENVHFLYMCPFVPFCISRERECVCVCACMGGVG